MDGDDVIVIPNSEMSHLLSKGERSKAQQYKCAMIGDLGEIAAVIVS